MSMAPRPPVPDLIPESAPFSAEQRTWLSGFFAGLVSLENGAITRLSSEQSAALMPGVPARGQTTRTTARPGTTRRWRLPSACSLPRAVRCPGV
jgi:hypothetical protein